MPSLRDLDEASKNRALDWLESLPNHPEVGGDIKRALKKAAGPHGAQLFPELSIEDRVSETTKKQAEKLDAFIAEQKDKENKEFWAKKREKAVNDGLIKNEEVADFHKWMIDERLGNYERAAKMWHDEKHAAAEPTNYQDVTGLSLPSNEGLFQNPIKWARDEGLAEINKIRRGKQA